MAALYKPGQIVDLVGLKHLNKFAAMDLDSEQLVVGLVAAVALAVDLGQSKQTSHKRFELSKDDLLLVASRFRPRCLLGSFHVHSNDSLNLPKRHLRRNKPTSGLSDLAKADIRIASNMD